MKRVILVLVLLLICSCSVEISELPTTEEKDYSMRFGVNGGAYGDYNKKGDVLEVTKDLDRLGLVWLRHPGEGSAWHEIETVNDEWDFSKIDYVLSDNYHPWVLELYGSLANPYPFEADFSRQHLNSLGGKDRIVDYFIEHGVNLNDEKEREEAEEYVKTYVTRYKDSIRYWEIGNEGIASDDRFDLVKYGYMWIKDVNPDSVVLVTAVAGDDDYTFEKDVEALDGLLEQGMGDYFDVANFHYYGKITDNFEIQLENAYDDYKEVLDKYGIDKPIWVTETGTSSFSDSVLSGPSSEKIQAQHVVKRLVVFSAKGAEKVFWHDYRDTNIGNKFYGCNLVEYETNEPKPSFYTFKLVVEKIGNYESVETLLAGDVRLYRFVNENDAVYVAWSTSGSQNLDLSEYIDGEAEVTHIVEEGSEPVVEFVDGELVLTESPVFIE